MLKDLGVLVTRPGPQSKNLIKLLEEYAANAIPYPVIEIVGIDNEQNLNRQLQKIDEYDLAIFISANAVTHGIRNIKTTQKGWPNSVPIAVLGAGTLKTLENCGLKAQIIPHAKFDTEGLLAHAALQQISGQSIAIFRGQGGRETLAQVLGQRGAKIEYFEVYKRILPQNPEQSIFEKWAEQVNIIVCTSNAGLENLLALARPNFQNLILNTPVLVVSERMQSKAQQLGFTQSIIVASNATDASIVEAIQEWRKIS